MTHLGTLLTLVFVGVVWLWWYGYWNYHGRKLHTTDGYITPAPGWRASKAMETTSWLGRYIFAGSCTIIGKENLVQVRDQRAIFLPSHVDEADGFVIFPELKRPFRYMASRDQLTGIRKRLAAFTGALAVDNNKRKSRGGAQEAAIEAMVRDGQRAALTIFMQGVLVRDNIISIDDFKPGAVRIGKAVVERSGDPNVVYVPMAVAYVQDETVGGLRRYCNELGAKVARRGLMVNNVGAVLVIGKPILVASLPDDDSEAKAVLVSAIEECSDRAKNVAAEKLEERKARLRVKS